MFRIDHATRIAVLPTPEGALASPGYFSRGNPGGGVPATIVTDDWANAVQEEICHSIEHAGLTLSKTDRTQLRQAIVAIAAGSAKAVVLSAQTFEASVANGEVVRWDSGNSRWDEALADGTAPNNLAVGVADVTNSKVYCFGETPALFSGLTPGSRYYLDATTPGALTTTPPADAVFVGVAKSATVMFIDIDPSLQAGSYAMFTDEKASGTAGGTFTSGAYQTRTLNTTRYNGLGASLSSNQITLPAGTYIIDAQCPAYEVNGHRARLQNVTGGTTLLLGSNQYADSGAGNNVMCSRIAGRITVAASQALELQHRGAVTAATNGFGLALSFGDNEVYSTIEIWKA